MKLQIGKPGNNMIDKLSNIYKGKKVFLTGHTGFKGAWLLRMLHMLGADVKGYALAPANNFDLYNTINGDQICQSIIGDIRDRDKLVSEVVNYQPDFVFHLAAQPLVRLSYELPAETFDVNVIGTSYVLDAIRKLEKECSVILITTDKVYYNNEWVHLYRENDRLGGYDPYSASKACAELLIDSYRNSFFNINNFDQHQKAISVARAGNVIGGGDWAKDRLLPDIVRALIAKETVVIRNPQSIRPWQHVLEPLFGYLLLGGKLTEQPKAFSQAYNFGPHAADTIAVEEMVKLAISNWGGGDFKNVSSIDQPHEAGLLKLDITKAMYEVGWKPQFTASEAVAYTIDWYKAYNTKKSEIVVYTDNQIKHYLQLNDK